MTGAVFAVALWAAAQGADLPTLILPPGDDAWVVRIVTAGGFTGRGTGSYTVSSAGEFLCLAVATCPATLVPDAHRTIAALVGTVRSMGAAPSRPLPITPGPCSDCVTTTLTVRRRDADGERTVSYTWDVSTAAAIPEEILRLHSALSAMVSPPSR